MIEKAKKLNEINRQVLLSYLHFLHMVEHMQTARLWDRAYRNIPAHWVGAYPRQHWVGNS